MTTIESSEEFFARVRRHDEAFELARSRRRDLEAPGADPAEASAAFWMDYYAEMGELDAARVRSIAERAFPWRDAPRFARPTTFDADAIR